MLYCQELWFDNFENTIKNFKVKVKFNLICPWGWFENQNKTWKAKIHESKLIEARIIYLDCKITELHLVFVNLLEFKQSKPSFFKLILFYVRIEGLLL